MDTNFIKTMIFIGLLMSLSACNEIDHQKVFLEQNDVTLIENDPVSGWYKFPLALKLDSGAIYRSSSIKNKAGYYTSNASYLDLGNELTLNTSYFNENLLGSNSTIMKSNILKGTDVMEWAAPKTRNLKTGGVVFFKNYDKEKWTSRIYFDASKKLDDKLMVVSLIVDPNDLFNYDTGIYLQGVLGDFNDPKKGNYSKRGKGAQRKSFVHFFENDGDLRFKTNAGVKIHGNLSRAQPQKSFTLLFRSKFGSKPIFSNLYGDTKYLHRMILRTPFTSSMQGQSLIMDSFIGEVAQKMNLDAMGSIPCNLYLNGEYWGIYHLREKVDQFYLKEKYSISKESIEIVEFNKGYKDNFKACYGEKNNWISLMTYIGNHDISKAECYEYVSQKIDLNNLIDYLILSTFFANKDWPGNNFKFWRSSDLDSKWRFIVQDMDACFRNDDMFNYLLTKNQTKGNNIASSTLLFRKLFKNKEFRKKFTSKYKELIEDELQTKNLILDLNVMVDKIAPSIQHQIDRWHMPVSYDSWEKRIEKMRIYLEKRARKYNEHMKNMPYE